MMERFAIAISKKIRLIQNKGVTETRETRKTTLLSQDKEIFTSPLYRKELAKLYSNAEKDNKKPGSIEGQKACHFMDIHNAYRQGKERFQLENGVKYRTGKVQRGNKKVIFESVNKSEDDETVLQQSPKHTKETYDQLQKTKKMRYQKKNDTDLISQNLYEAETEDS